jgi:hypothetical protein
LYRVLRFTLKKKENGNKGKRKEKKERGKKEGAQQHLTQLTSTQANILSNIHQQLVVKQIHRLQLAGSPRFWAKFPSA